MEEYIMGMTNKQFQGFIRLALNLINKALEKSPDNQELAELKDIFQSMLEDTRTKGGIAMPSGAEIIRDYITEFSRLQNWMLQTKGKAPEAYDSMYQRYIELKVTLTSLGVNVSELDRIGGTNHD
jgi:antitoxin component HigA of HigAB toxin-antitoxin module